MKKKIVLKKNKKYSHILHVYVNGKKTDIRIVGYMVGDTAKFDDCVVHQGMYTIYANLNLDGCKKYIYRLINEK